MRTLGLMLVLALVISGAAMAEVGQMDIYSDWNLVGPPVVPLDPNPVSVFSGLDIEFVDVLQRLDAPTQNYLAYLFFEPETFGNVLLGDGYFVLSYTGNATCTFDGVADGVPDSAGNMTDMWISLPGNQLDGVDEGGWHIISCPFNHDIPFNEAFFGYDGENIKVTDGTQTLGLLAAAGAGWIDEPWSYLDASTQNYLSAGFASGVYEDDELRAGKGYLVKTNKDNLALIIPADRPY